MANVAVELSYEKYDSSAGIVSSREVVQKSGLTVNVPTSKVKEVPRPVMVYSISEDCVGGEIVALRQGSAKVHVTLNLGSKAEDGEPDVLTWNSRM